MLKKNFYLTQEQNDFLNGLNGLSASEHLRRAIDDYIIKMKIEVGKATTSPSKMKIYQYGEEVTA